MNDGLIADNLSVKGSGLQFCGQDVAALAKEYGTPLYLMDEDCIRALPPLSGGGQTRIRRTRTGAVRIESSGLFAHVPDHAGGRAQRGRRFLRRALYRL